MPKGISITHANLVNQIELTSSLFGVQGDTVLQQSAPSFDMSIWQVFLALSNGGRLVIASKDTRRDLNALVELISTERVQVVTATPSELQAWLRLDEGRQLRKSAWRVAVAGGEQVTPSLLRIFRELAHPRLDLYNVYGPSEVTIVSNVAKLDYQNESTESQAITVGRSLPNYSVYLLDDQSEPVPIGYPGEVFIGGAGIARGYLSNDDLTREKFTRDKFASRDFLEQGWTTAHRSGDRGRLLSNGELLIEGRIDGDTQIKLRGIRVDLQDIEKAILSHSNGLIREAIVSVRNQGQGALEFLVAHVVYSSSGRTIQDPAQYLSELRSSLPLPSYMLPASILPVQELPQGVSGKVSRAAVALLPVEISPAGPSHSATLSSEEQKLKNIWIKTLSGNTEKLTINSSTDFFHTGGNSLLLLQLQKNIRKVTGVDVPLVTLFESSTLGEMASKIFGAPMNPAPTDKERSTTLDWAEETKLPSTFSQLKSMRNPPNNRHGTRATVRVVALTGGTGFLGRALLKELLEDRNIEKIHILAVRSPEAASSLRTSSKIEVHQGDLTAPLLGLESATAQRIFAEADAVIHNGADVSFLKTYSSLRPANVDSTIELARLSLQHGATFHYISTAGVGQLTGKDSVQPVNLGNYEPPKDGSAGYISSKWVSEQLLDKASKQFGLNVVVHRPTNITGEGAPEDDIMTNLLRYSRQLATVPKFKQLKGYINFVPVEDVAFETVRSVMAGDHHGISYAHRVGVRDIPLDGMRKHLESESRQRVRRVSLDDWLIQAKRAGLREMVAAYLSSLERLEQPVVLPRLLR